MSKDARYIRLKDESLEKYNYRVCRQKDLGIYDLTWDGVRDILNDVNGEVYGSSKWRKDYQVVQRYLDGIGDNVELSSEIINELKQAKEELKIQEKASYIALTQLRDEKNEERSWWRLDGRNDRMYARLDEAIDRFSSYKPQFVPENIVANKENDSAVVFFADAHYGEHFKIEGLLGDIIAEYSPEIFKERMWKLRDEILDFQKIHGINNFYIADLGDAVSGILRMSSLKGLKENVVDDIMNYADFIDEWLKELSKSININFYMSEGNHSVLKLLSSGKANFLGENLEKIYCRVIMKSMKDNPNVTVHQSIRGINYFDVQGKKFLTVHGQHEKNLLNSIKDYEDVYKVSIDYLGIGHLHSKMERDANGGKEIIQARSIMGANEYSIIDLKKWSPSGATMFSVRKDVGRKHVNEVKFN